MAPEQPAINSTSFETQYPTITEWVTVHGWIEIGQDEYSRSMVRALDEGGMVWEGQAEYASMDVLFNDLEVNLAKWAKEDG